MNATHAKAVRRRLLLFLYDRYQADPSQMLGVEAFLEGEFTRPDLIFNIHYLHDSGLVELLMGYQPPLFAAARITAKGIDVVENRFELNLRFPALPQERDEAYAELPHLIEQLVNEAELSPLDGDERRALLRDVAYLREEVARPAGRWRRGVVAQTLDAIAAPIVDPSEHLPSLGAIRRMVIQDT